MMYYKLGVDIGSTTIKCVLLDNNDKIIYKSYERHFSRVRQMTLEKLIQLKNLLQNNNIKIAITGSAGLGIANISKLPFVQEVFATSQGVKKYYPDIDSVIELGGEDAKIIFLKGIPEERMNSTCAGGTGSFIDQMAGLLNVDLETLDKLSLNHTCIYTIASRCGVFAKTDIQPLINQGANKADLAASIFQSVTNQTITGLAQGRKIEGKVLFLGGPLAFFKGLRERFKITLNLDDDSAIYPDSAQHFIALGAAVYAGNQPESYTYDDLITAMEKVVNTPIKLHGLDPLFKDKSEYDEFLRRHKNNDVNYIDITKYKGKAYLGIDAGSTTTKLILIDDQANILYNHYCRNNGNPIDVILSELKKIYDFGSDRIKICGSAVTGYGEELMCGAFKIDIGIVETIAHYTAAKHFNSNVSFIIDIGGQDMKCFHIKYNAIDSVLLNEACSSGCGSFIETFANSMGYKIEDFAELGLYAKSPVDLGTRCTVFMNSSVKQAQKDGATVEDISAGLSMSIVKNALYKVIRVNSPSELGSNIVVQGGTFLNDSVLRSFEKELGINVTRPQIAGLMGAYGAALIAMNNMHETNKVSTLITPNELNSFTHTAVPSSCKGCTNNCRLTVNKFNDGRKFISGNKCERPVTGEVPKNMPNMFEYKYNLLMSLEKHQNNRRNIKIGIPLVLNMYENLPFWNAFFGNLGFDVVVSDRSTQKLYITGQNTISSDTVCYPAKLVHGHIQNLVDKNIDILFYPCMTYNCDEGISDNHYNCPVVAYYPEVIKANMQLPTNVDFLLPYISINDKKNFINRMTEILKSKFTDINMKQVREASDVAYSELDKFHVAIKAEGIKIIDYASEHDMKIIVLSGRPYHIDPLINHGIDGLVNKLGLAVLSEDAIPTLKSYEKLNVLNQWTYHARMYNAAKFIKDYKNIEFVQLVSFGCGIDAITTDELKDILRGNGKLYTQIKIDEINNLGAVKIRLRSLLAAMDERD